MEDSLKRKNDKKGDINDAKKREIEKDESGVHNWNGEKVEKVDIEWEARLMEREKKEQEE